MQFITCFCAGLKLGLTSFGGPVAHLGYFREAYVLKKGWLSEERFAELLAICQFLPGPASSQLGAAIGFHKGGWLGALGSWLGFTLPSALLMIALAIGLTPLTEQFGSGWIHGLKLAAVAIVAIAVIGMRKKLCPRTPETLVALAALSLLIFVSQPWMQPLVILLGGLVGSQIFGKDAPMSVSPSTKQKAPFVSLMGIGVFCVALCFLPILANLGVSAAATAGLVKSGSLVFGGGHVVLPLLETSFVGDGQVNMAHDEFLTGYGAAQAVPGPMFTLASYLGAFVEIGGNAIVGGLLGTLAIFAPGMFLLCMGMPLWDWMKHHPRVQGAIKGANAAVVGLLAAALFHLLKSGVIVSALDCVVALVLFVGMGTRYLPIWLGVLLAGVVGWILW